MSLRKILSIDPGITRSGFAIWRGGILYRVVDYTGYGNSWEDRVKFLCMKYSEILTLRDFDLIYCEYPKIFNTPSGLQIGLSGSIEKLTFLIGAYRGIAFSQNINFKLVTVDEWKGQLPKEVCHIRVKKVLTQRERQLLIGRPHDTWDAVGIGLHVLGRF